MSQSFYFSVLYDFFYILNFDMELLDKVLVNLDLVELRLLIIIHSYFSSNDHNQEGIDILINHYISSNDHSQVGILILNLYISSNDHSQVGTLILNDYVSSSNHNQEEFYA